MKLINIRLLSVVLIGLLLGTGLASGQMGRRGGSALTWIDDTHYLDLQKDKDGKDIRMSVDAVTGKAKPYLVKTEVSETPRPGVSVKEGELYYSDGTDASSRKITANPGKEVNPRLSPDQNRVAFTRDNDLFVIDLATNLEHRLTVDGTNLIYNGYASWVYFEEILGRGSQYCAFWWSPDSKKLAFLRFDDTEVPLFILMRGDSLHGAPEYTRYPKAGDPNPKVKLGIADLETGKITWAKFDYSVDQYIAWPFWKPDSREMMVQVLNRDQNHMQFFMVAPETGDVRKIYDEQRTTWVDFFEDIRVLKNGTGFIINSYRNDWHNLYYHDWNGKQLAHLTDVKWRVSGVTQVDEEKGIVYFTGRPESAENHFFKVNLDGTGLVQLTEGAGSHSVSLSPGGSYLIDSWNSVTTPGRRELRDASGKLVRLISETPLEYDPAKNHRAEYVRIPGTDGFQLPAVIIYPVNFSPANKYPVVFTIYGGPDAGGVRNAFPGNNPGWFAQNGIITINVDHRASGHFGKKGLDYMWRNLGKWEMVDYAEAVKWLRTKPFVDPTRMGITGGSYGGYTTCLALTAGADYWTHGMALYSVSDWGLYDNVYTERFMDTPKQNPEGYKNGTAMNFADKLKGKLYIVHGEMDDNVHMQNSLQLVSKLEDLGKEFQLMIYPNGRHGWGGPKATHVRDLQNKFWLKEFFGK
jgi:dipeptidyl-peptidase 4